MNATEPHIITNSQPNMIYIYCQPCACQVATALTVCRHRDKKSSFKFSIRIDHRLKIVCSAPVSRIEGLILVVDYPKDQEKEVDYSLEDDTVEDLAAIDREWLERQTYNTRGTLI